MSAERNYQCFLEDHAERRQNGTRLKDVAKMDAKGIESWAGLNIARDDKGAMAPGGDGEEALKRKLSQAIGRVMESHYDTRIPTTGPEKGIRISEVPERHTPHMNRLRDELYARVVVEKPAD